MSYPEYKCNNANSPDLAGHRMNNSWQVMIFDLTVLHPRCEVSKLSVVSVVGQPHLWADMKDFVIVDDHSAIVDHVLVDDGPGVLC